MRKSGPLGCDRFRACIEVGCRQEGGPHNVAHPRGVSAFHSVGGGGVCVRQPHAAVVERQQFPDSVFMPFHGDVQHSGPVYAM